ncbi:MAG TPA: hypothetical protein ENH41_03430 [Candidatus Omnitrophica bacterium]|nr:hypothetical protein [Candidatus Omnitrophota bacterium]
MDKIKEVSETEFQDICSDFVGKEVYMCSTHETEYILKKAWEDKEAPFSWDDIENGYIDICPSCGEELDITTPDENDEYCCTACNTSFDNPENNPQEIFEWWYVSSWLCDKLADLGHPVIKDYQLWGRCTTGQAILLDGVICNIVTEYRHVKSNGKY